MIFRVGYLEKLLFKEADMSYIIIFEYRGGYKWIERVWNSSLIM